MKNTRYKEMKGKSLDKVMSAFFEAASGYAGLVPLFEEMLPDFKALIERTFSVAFDDGYDIGWMDGEYNKQIKEEQ